MLFAIQVQNTGHIFLLLVCIVALGHENNMFLIPARAQKSRRTRFSFYCLFLNFHTRKRRQNIFEHAQ